MRLENHRKCFCFNSLRTYAAPIRLVAIPASLAASPFMSEIECQIDSVLVGLLRLAIGVGAGSIDTHASNLCELA